MKLEKKEYESKWQTQTDDAVSQLLNRKPFQYDVNADALYKQVADRYIAGGRMAMQDTMGQAQTMTGGYGNSYAQMAGQQAYQGYLQGLNDKVPEFYQMALNQYQMEGDRLMDRYGILSNQDSIDYGRYQDDLAYNQWLTEFLEDKRRYDQEWDFATRMGVGGSGGNDEDDADSDEAYRLYQQAVSQGYGSETAKNALKNAGYSEATVNSAMSKYKQNIVTPLSKPEKTNRGTK